MESKGQVGIGHKLGREPDLARLHRRAYTISAEYYGNFQGRENWDLISMLQVV